jgi:hypothetical protein
MSDNNRFSSILKTAHEHIDQPAEETAAVATAQPATATKRQAPRMSRPIGGPLTGKRSNPDYEPTTVILRRETKNAAAKILVGNKEKDLSDILESLLAGWVRKNS